MSLRKKLNEQVKVVTFKELCEGLTDTEIEKFKALADGIEYDESYKEKLNVIKENYFQTKTSKSSGSVETLEENSENKEESDANVARYVRTLSKMVER